MYQLLQPKPGVRSRRRCMCAYASVYDASPSHKGTLPRSVVVTVIAPCLYALVSSRSRLLVETDTE